MKDFFNKPQVKNILLAIPGIIIGALCSALGSWENRNTAFWVKSGIAIFFLIVYIILLIFYSTNEVNERRVKGMVLVSMWVVIPFESVLRDLKYVMLFPI